MKFLDNLIKLIIINALTVSCAAIPGKNIKLENYPKIEGTNNLDLSYKKIKFDENLNEKSEENFTVIIALHLINSKITSDKPTNCIVNISSRNDVKGLLLAPYAWISMLTLMIIPYYVPLNFEAKAQLISQKDNRVLKEYYLKDKAHEVWSIFLLLGIASKYQRDDENWGTTLVPNTIAEALTRQIIHDANQFPECKK